jgi:hypothetical protein
MNGPRPTPPDAEPIAGAAPIEGRHHAAGRNGASSPQGGRCGRRRGATLTPVLIVTMESTQVHRNALSLRGERAGGWISGRREIDGSPPSSCTCAPVTTGARAMSSWGSIAAPFRLRPKGQRRFLDSVSFGRRARPQGCRASLAPLACAEPTAARAERRRSRERSARARGPGQSRGVTRLRSCVAEVDRRRRRPEKHFHFNVRSVNGG